LKIQKIRNESNESSQVLRDTKLSSLNSFELSKEDAKNKTIAVLDTNIFLSHHKSIANISSKDAKNVLFVVPWVVIQELDNCKSKKDYSININFKSQKSIKIIMNALQTNSKQFLFENSFQVCSF
jgi:hypothetical protein